MVWWPIFSVKYDWPSMMNKLSPFDLFSSVGCHLEKMHRCLLVIVSSRASVLVLIAAFFGWLPQALAHGKYAWMMPYQTKTGASCCGVDDCGKIVAWDTEGDFITIENQFGRVWNVRYRFAGVTLHYSPDGGKYACGTYSSYVPNYARCLWLPPEAKARAEGYLASLTPVPFDRPQPPGWWNSAAISGR